MRFCALTSAAMASTRALQPASHAIAVVMPCWGRGPRTSLPRSITRAAAVISMSLLVAADAESIGPLHLIRMVQPRSSALGVRRSGQLLDDPLEVHRRRISIAEQAVADCEAAEQLAARVHGGSGAAGRLEPQDLFPIADRLLQERLRLGLVWKMGRAGQQHRTARNQRLQIIRLQRHRVVHLLETATLEIESSADVAGAKLLTGLIHETPAMPDERRGVARILCERLLADRHAARESGGVAAIPGEEIRANDVVEALCQQEGCRGDRDDRESRDAAFHRPAPLQMCLNSLTGRGSVRRRESTNVTESR